MGGAGFGMGGAGFGDPYVPRRFVGGNQGPPAFPQNPRRQVNWLHSIRRYLNDSHLEHTLNEDPVSGPVCVVRSDRSSLLSNHPEIIVRDHIDACVQCSC